MSRQASRTTYWSASEEDEWRKWLEVVRLQFAQSHVNYLLLQRARDERPYMSVSILGTRVKGLLDSGSTRTIIAEKLWNKIKSSNSQVLKSSTKYVTVADGSKCPVLGSVNLPFVLESRVKIIDTLIVPKLNCELILGIDFWRSMDIIANFNVKMWEFCTSASESASVVELRDAELLTAEEQETLYELTTKYFAKMGSGLGCAKGIAHEINTGDAKPIKQRYYQVSPYVQEKINKELDKMLQLGVVERSQSPWSSPVVLVKKSNGESRFCVDYRQLNKVTKRDAYPLPYVNMILDRLRDAKFLSSLDLKSAYWQIPLEKHSREKTAFTVPGRGLYHFVRLPFGLTNAPATWQRLIDQVLGPELEPFVFVYLDDIIIATPTFSMHIDILKKTLDKLLQAGLTVNRDKCEFVRPMLKYLGYIIDRNGLRVDPDKVSCILEFPRPKTSSEVRRFVGLASWYRRFVPEFSRRVAPLTRLTRKHQKFSWTSDAEEAFLDLKQCLVSAPILTCPDFTKPFILQTDASQVGLGAVLSQEFEDGEKVIAYASRAVTQSEQKYCATELECLCVIWAVEKFRAYLEGSSFKVITDHHSLLWLQNLKDPHGRLARWALRLQGYDFSITHRKGSLHAVPDALSRAIPQINLIEITANNHDKWYSNMLGKVTKFPDKFPRWQVKDNKLYKFVQNSQADFEQLHDWKLVVPKALRTAVLQENHDFPTAGHLGIFKTRNRVARLYYWPKMNADIIKYVRKCPTCLAHKADQNRPAGVMGQRTATRPWQIICMDLMGPFPISSKRNRFLLVVADIFTKFVLFFPLTTATSAAVTRHIENDVFLLFGVPQYIICDNGKQFISESFRKMVGSYASKIVFNAYYHPQANPTERVNRVIKTMISSYVEKNQREWDKHIGKLGFAIRTAVHEVTGYSPAYLNFGREIFASGNQGRGDVDDHENSEFDYGSRVKWAEHLATLPSYMQRVQVRLQQAYERSAARYNLRHRPLKLQVGQLVWKRNFSLSDATKYYSSKLAPKYIECRVLKQISQNVYELCRNEDGKNIGNWHIKDLKTVAS